MLFPPGILSSSATQGRLQRARGGDMAVPGHYTTLIGTVVQGASSLEPNPRPRDPASQLDSWWRTQGEAQTGPTDCLFSFSPSLLVTSGFCIAHPVTKARAAIYDTRGQVVQSMLCIRSLRLATLFKLYLTSLPYHPPRLRCLPARRPPAHPQHWLLPSCRPLSASTPQNP